MEKDKFENYLYFHGEERCPFHGVGGKSTWWRVERYAFEAGDDKKKGELSKTMIRYLRNRVSLHEDFDLRQATEFYLKGEWFTRWPFSEPAKIVRFGSPLDD